MTESCQLGAAVAGEMNPICLCLCVSMPVRLCSAAAAVVCPVCSPSTIGASVVSVPKTSIIGSITHTHTHMHRVKRVRVS